LRTGSIEVAIGSEAQGTGAEGYRGKLSSLPKDKLDLHCDKVHEVKEKREYHIEGENKAMNVLFDELAPFQQPQSQPLDIPEKDSSQAHFIKSTSPLKSSQLIYREEMKPQNLEQETVKGSPLVEKPVFSEQKGEMTPLNQIEKIDLLEKRLSSPAKSVHDSPMRVERVQLLTPTTKMPSIIKTKTSPFKIPTTPKRVLFREEESVPFIEQEKENGPAQITNPVVKKIRLYSDW
jgi:hypothetical protein